MISLRLRSPARELASRFGFIVAASALMALAAHVSLPVPFSPVPLTGQTMALPLVVALLGTRGAVLALVLYLVEGAAGMPVFSPHGGPGGLLAFAGPSGGYLVAFPVAAYVTGSLFDRGSWSSYSGRVLAIAAGTLVVLVAGAAWLACFIGPKAALAAGVAPFAAGEALKTLIAAGVTPLIRGGRL